MLFCIKMLSVNNSVEFLFIIILLLFILSFFFSFFFSPFFFFFFFLYNFIDILELQIKT